MDTKEISNIVKPVPPGTKRPLWSVMIPTFNPNEKFLIESINSVIIQDPGPEKMQIEVVDDCSTKVDIKKIIDENWKDRVLYHRLPKNVGHSFNFTESVRRAKGELVHLLHDDDKVKPGFYDTFEDIFNKYENIGAAFCRQEYIDESGNLKFYSEPEMPEQGILEDALIKLAQKQRIQYCAMVIRRKVFENIGGFVTKNIGCEDWEMWVRIAAHYPVAYEPKALAEYRVHHGTSMTLKDMRSGQDMRYMREAIAIFNEYLPKEKREETDLFRRRYYGDYSFKNAKRLLEEFEDKEGAAAQLSETIKIDPELIYGNIKFITDLKTPIESAGVSVVICTKNNEDKIERTLRHLFVQRVPEYIPWEIIIADSGSSDNTLQYIEDTLIKYKCKIPLRILKPESRGILEVRDAAIENAKYNYILFCNPGDLLNTDYVRMVSVNMMRDMNLGVLGGYIESKTEFDTPPWFKDWSNYNYQIGEQYEYTSAVTWTRGYVWGSGMAIRKDAWKSLYEKKFRSLFPGSENEVSRFSIDNEMCFALRLAGWSIWYSIDLKLKHMFSKKELSWMRLREMWKQNGKNSIILYPYIHTKERKKEDLSNIHIHINKRKKIAATYRKLKRFRNWKLQSYNESLTGDNDVLLMEFKLAKLRELLSQIKTYNKKIRLLRRIASKRDLKFLRYVINKPYFRYPQYQNSSDKRGISVILNFTNSSYNLLFRSLEKISVQTLPENFPWEVILVTDFIKEDIKNEIYRSWERSNCSASLKICEERISNPETIRRIAVDRSRFNYLVFLNEYDLIYPDYVRIAYKAIHKNKTAGLVGGQTKLASDVNPPKWFGKYTEMYAIGKHAEESCDITDSKEYLWNSALVARKKAIEDSVKANPFFENYENEKGNLQLSYDLDLSARVKLSGWRILYEERLKSGRYVSVNQFKWEYLRKLYYSKGSEEAFESAYPGIFIDKGNNKKSWMHNANRTLLELNKYPFRKLFSKENEYRNDTEVLEIEKLRGRLKGVIKYRDKYIKISEGFKSNLNGKSNGHSGNISNRNDNLKVTRPGVSIVICCYNSSTVLPETLKHICTQKVPDNIPWEVIVVDNASTDNTSKTAEDIWMRFNCLASFKIVKETVPGLSAARLKGFNTAKFDYVVFCDDDNWLNKDYVKNVFEIMNSHKDIGVLGGQSKAEFDIIEPVWFKDWRNSYAIGKQSENDGDITFTRGYVWGAAMTVRKEAWNDLISKGFRSLLSDRKGNSLSAGGDTEICYALRNEGWKIWYDHRLKFKHFISEKRLNWKYLRKLFRGFGQASPGLDHYAIIDTEKSKKGDFSGESYSIRKEINKTLKILRKTRYKKLLSYDIDRSGDSDIPMIEYCLGRIEGLLKLKGTYNLGIKTLKKTARKKDHKYLRAVFKNYYSNYPRFKTIKKLNGVSVIICTYNGEDRLADTVRHIANQKTDKRLLWELILVDNASTDNTKQTAIDEWKKHDINANLVIVDEHTPGLSSARQKGFDTAKYEYIVLCDDDNWLEDDFVQTTYDIMSSNDKIGILGGPNEALCELEPPDWFKWFQQGYAAGDQADLKTGKVVEGNITWKRGFVWGAGMIVRRKALKELYSKGFKSIMSDRKGTKLSSGGDSELCFALVLSGWQVWYDTRLKLKHCMPAGRVSWDYLIRLFEGFGITSVGLDYYEKAIRAGRADSDLSAENKMNWKYEYKKSLKEVKKFGYKNLFSLRLPQENNTNIPMMEYHLARLIELRRVKDEYDRNIKAVNNAKWRIDNKELKAYHRKFIETENDFRYGWPWGNEPEIQSPVLKTVPKISILSPSFNSVNTIEKAILSVLKQGYPNFEHIICDGGSSDGTVEILKKYPHLKWVSEPDNGQCDAMNKAFERSTGDIISYLNVDDYYQRGAFYKIAKAFETDPTAEMVVGNLYFEYDDHTFIRKPEIDYKKIMLPFRYIFPINPVSYFYKRNVQTEAGPFPLDNHFTMDYWFLLKAYQNHKLVKIEDYLGTFCMNGFNKTSGADNRKNTHYRVLEHCWKYDRKNLPYYLYNYYKFFYYEKQPYNLEKVYYKFKKNLSRIISIITLKKNKYYSESLFLSARSRYYLNQRTSAVMRLGGSFLIYPKGLAQRSRQSLFIYSVLGKKYSEKAKLAYFFFTTPPGLPLANKLHYYGNEFKKEKKSVKGNSLLFLTYIISPGFLFKKNKADKPTSEKSTNGKSLKEISYDYFYKAGEKYYFHKNFQATILMMMSFLTYPFSIKDKSRLNLFAYSSLGNSITDKLRFAYHLYKDNPEYTLAHKINYYGNELRKEGSSGKGNMVLFFSYILSPKYIKMREKIVKSNAVYVSNFIEEKRKSSINPYQWASGTLNNLRQLNYRKRNFGTYLRNSGEKLKYSLKRGYHYFRYRKYKAKSKMLYAQAIENYNSGKRMETVKALIPSYLLYPVSIFNRNKLSLMKNSILKSSKKINNTGKEK